MMANKTPPAIANLAQRLVVIMNQTNYITLVGLRLLGRGGSRLKCCALAQSEQVKLVCNGFIF